YFSALINPGAESCFLDEEVARMFQRDPLSVYTMDESPWGERHMTRCAPEAGISLLWVHLLCELVSDCTIDLLSCWSPPSPQSILKPWKNTPKRE
ncbi:uncharacterized, partial [Tachysurus ichikawai]